VRLRADQRPHPPAAITPDVPGAELRDPLVLSAQARLRSARGADPVPRLEPAVGGDDLSAIAFGSVWIGAGRTYDTIWRLNPATRQADAVIKVGKSPFNVTADAHGLWVAVRDAGTIVRIDPRTDTVTKAVRLGFKPQGMAVGAGALWVAIGHGELPSLG
jgi:DNA-binding beta-propeller fold protein YncE